jgi:hypothetical protein
VHPERKIARSRMTTAVLMTFKWMIFRNVQSVVEQIVSAGTLGKKRRALLSLWGPNTVDLAFPTFGYDPVSIVRTEGIRI